MDLPREGHWSPCKKQLFFFYHGNGKTPTGIYARRNEENGSVDMLSRKAMFSVADRLETCGVFYFFIFLVFLLLLLLFACSCD